MSPKAPPARPSGPHARQRQATRARIVAAAAGVFLAKGYVGASMSAIAAAAGVTKRTLYLHFDHKDDLFHTVVEDARSRARADQAIDERLLRDGDSLPRDLVTFGTNHLRAIQHPELRALRRLIIWEVGQHPQLLAKAMEGAPRRVEAWLTERFTALAADGALDLDPPAPARAAHELIALLFFDAQTHSVHWTEPIGPARCRRIAGAAADVFLRAYAPRG